MRGHSRKWLRWMLPAISACAATLIYMEVGHVIAAPPIDYCPTRTPDQQLGASLRPERPSGPMSAPGCIPLVEKKEQTIDDPPATDATSGQPKKALRIENLQRDASMFLQKYREFLRCCSNDLAELETVEKLGNEVGDLLQMAQTGLFSEQMKLRGFTLAEIIPPVAKARADLGRIRVQLEDIRASVQRGETMGYEEAGREALAIQEMEESIKKGIRPGKIPASPKTGVDIGTSPSVGTEIGTVPKVGTGIGAEGLTGRDVGVTPKTGPQIGGTGPTGFEIGNTGRAGSEVGESNLNSNPSAVGSSLPSSTVGSDLRDSTVNSNFRSSTIGSDLQDSTIGSTFGNSSVGSSLQNRGTAPSQ